MIFDDLQAQKPWFENHILSVKHTMIEILWFGTPTMRNHSFADHNHFPKLGLGGQYLVTKLGLDSSHLQMSLNSCPSKHPKKFTYYKYTLIQIDQLVKPAISFYKQLALKNALKNLCFPKLIFTCITRAQQFQGLLDTFVSSACLCQ